MWLMVYKNFTNSYFQQRFSIIGRWGQVAAESKTVKCVEGNRECPTYPSRMWGISPDVVFGMAQQRS